MTFIVYPQCPYCGLTHSSVCPRIKEIEYHPDGTVKQIVFQKFAREKLTYRQMGEKYPDYKQGY
jgi:hypothetical protein